MTGFAKHVDLPALSSDPIYKIILSFFVFPRPDILLVDFYKVCSVFESREASVCRTKDTESLLPF